MKNKEQNILEKAEKLSPTQESSLGRAERSMEAEADLSLNAIILALLSKEAVLELRDDPVDGQVAIVKRKDGELLMQTGDKNEVNELVKASRGETVVEEIDTGANRNKEDRDPVES